MLNSRKYSWLNPAEFINPDSASLLSTFFCAFCAKGNAIKLLFKPDKTIEIDEQVEYKSLINENSPAFWLEDVPEGEEENVDEDLLTLLQDPPVKED